MEKKVYSAAPVYLFALAFLLYGLFLPVYRLGHLLGGLAVGAAVFALSDRLLPRRSMILHIKEKLTSTGDEQLDQTLEKCRAALGRIRKANDLIPGERVSAQLDRMEAAGERIFRTVAENPDRMPRVRKFMNYYLPTTVKLVEYYARLDQLAAAGKNMSDSKREIEESLEMIAQAFEKQLDNLFQDDALDISTDIDVLESMLAGEGLAGETLDSDSKKED